MIAELRIAAVNGDVMMIRSMLQQLVPEYQPDQNVVDWVYVQLFNSNDTSIVFNGKTITDIPEDLFIPPEALRVIIEQFEGPLDLLLYLIKKQNIDIVDIPILPITNQYVEYINMMQEMQFELASDYLVMASTLAEIKSRMLVPNEEDEEDEEETYDQEADKEKNEV